MSAGLPVDPAAAAVASATSVAANTTAVAAATATVAAEKKQSPLEKFLSTLPPPHKPLSFTPRLPAVTSTGQANESSVSTTAAPDQKNIAPANPLHRAQVRETVMPTLHTVMELYMQFLQTTKQLLLIDENEKMVALKKQLGKKTAIFSPASLEAMAEHRRSFGQSSAAAATADAKQQPSEFRAGSPDLSVGANLSDVDSDAAAAPKIYIFGDSVDVSRDGGWVTGQIVARGPTVQQEYRVLFDDATDLIPNIVDNESGEMLRHHTNLSPTCQYQTKESHRLWQQLLMLRYRLREKQKKIAAVLSVVGLMISKGDRVCVSKNDKAVWEQCHVKRISHTVLAKGTMTSIACTDDTKISHKVRWAEFDTCVDTDLILPSFSDVLECAIDDALCCGAIGFVMSNNANLVIPLHL